MSAYYTIASAFSLRREGKAAISDRSPRSVGCCIRVEICMSASFSPLSPYRFQSLQWKILRLPLTLSRYQEVSDLLYTQNTFEFDHPMTLRLFKKTLHPSSLNSIKSISINLQKGLYYPLTPTQAYTHLRDWQDMWSIISAMEGLEEIRVRFQFPAKWSFMSPEKEMLASLWQVNRPMRVFEVDTGGAIFFNFEQTADAPFKLLRHEA